MFKSLFNLFKKNKNLSTNNYRDVSMKYAKILENNEPRFIRITKSYDDLLSKKDEFFHQVSELWDRLSYGYKIRLNTKISYLAFDLYKYTIYSLCYSTENDKMDAKILCILKLNILKNDVINFNITIVGNVSDNEKIISPYSINSIKGAIELLKDMIKNHNKPCYFLINKLYTSCLDEIINRLSLVYDKFDYECIDFNIEVYTRSAYDPNGEIGYSLYADDNMRVNYELIHSIDYLKS